MSLLVKCPTDAYFQVRGNGRIQCTTSSSDSTSAWTDANLLTLSESDFYELSAWTILIVLTAFGIKMLLKLFNEDSRR
jgi:hypothetical protein